MRDKGEKNDQEERGRHKEEQDISRRRKTGRKWKKQDKYQEELRI